ncbi:restriction endonuclease subunit S, partial [Vibrio cholerae]|nr:restriction endonuclease subunit S [Vibrio cholerae]
LDLVIDHRGKTPKKMGFEDFHPTGYPVLSAKNVKTDRLVNEEAIRFANEAMYKKWMKVEIQEGDIVLTSEAPLGQVYYLNGKTKYLLSQRVFGLRPKKEEINPLYLAAWLASAKGQALLEARATGSTVLGIKQAELLKVEVDVPPEDIQELVARNRYDLVNKIDINTKTNQTLEQIAQAIFKSWFVDFDPVKAKMETLAAGGSADDAELAAMSVISAKTIDELNSLKVSNPEAFNKHAQTAALFPATMQDSELGEIPEGWKVVTIKSLSEKISKGTTPSKKDLVQAQDEESIRFIKVKDINDQGEILRDSLEVIPNSIHIGKLRRSILEKNDILFSIAGTIGRVATVDNDLNNVNTNQAVAFIRLEDKKHFLPLVYMTLRDRRLQDKALASIVQGVQANLSLNSLGDMEVILPSNEVLELWNKQYKSIFKMIKSNFAESRKLSSLRDTLLPKLLAGEIDLTSEVTA